MNWINTKDKLPEPNKYVLGVYAETNWIDSDDKKKVNCCVVKLVKGISLEDREKLSDLDGRKRLYQFGDEEGNNKLPYRWDSFGPLTFNGEDISYWMEIPSLPFDALKTDK